MCIHMDTAVPYYPSCCHSTGCVVLVLSTCLQCKFVELRASVACIGQYFLDPCTYIWTLPFHIPRLVAIQLGMLSWFRQLAFSTKLLTYAHQSHVLVNTFLTNKHTYGHHCSTSPVKLLFNWVCCFSFINLPSVQIVDLCALVAYIG